MSRYSRDEYISRVRFRERNLLGRHGVYRVPFFLHLRDPSRHASRRRVMSHRTRANESGNARAGVSIFFANQESSVYSYGGASISDPRREHRYRSVFPPSSLLPSRKANPYRSGFTLELKEQPSRATFPSRKPLVPRSDYGENGGARGIDEATDENGTDRDVFDETNADASIRLNA